MKIHERSIQEAHGTDCSAPTVRRECELLCRELLRRGEAAVELASAAALLSEKDR